MADVVTRGTGEVERTADRALLRVTYEAAGPDRPAAVLALGQRVAKVEPLLPREDVEIRGRWLSVHARWERKRQTGCTAVMNYELRIAPPEGLDQLIADLLGTDPASLNGPAWELTDRSEAIAEAQQLAVGDARRRAEGYAVALGMRIGGLLRLEDSDSGGVMYRAAPMSAGASEDMLQAVRELNLEPQPVAVTASCTTTWSLLA